jgi:hypothetical protein
VRVWEGLRVEKAIRQAIRDELAAMAKEVKEDDVVFLFLSGHGRVPPGQEMFYYIPYLPPAPDSAVVVDPIEEREVGLNTAILAEAIRNLAAWRVVLVVYACQSGGAVESLGKIGEVKLAVEERRASQEKASGRTDHSHEVGVYILAAATPVQEALEPLPGPDAVAYVEKEIAGGVPNLLTIEDFICLQGHTWGFSSTAIQTARAGAQHYDNVAGLGHPRYV